MCKYICLYLDCTMYIYKVYCTIISNVYLIMFHLSISFWSDIYKQGRQSGLRSVGAQLDGAENFGVCEDNSCSKIEKIMAPNLTTLRAEVFTSNKWQKSVPFHKGVKFYYIRAKSWARVLSSRRFIINLFLFFQRDGDEKFNFQTKTFKHFSNYLKKSRKFQTFIKHADIWYFYQSNEVIFKHKAS